VLEEAGIDAASYLTLNSRPLVYAPDCWRHGLAAACAARAALGPDEPGALRRVDAVLRDRYQR